MRSQLLSRRNLSRLLAGVGLVCLWSVLIYSGNHFLRNRSIDGTQPQSVADMPTSSVDDLSTAALPILPDAEVVSPSTALLAVAAAPVTDVRADQPDLLAQAPTSTPTSVDGSSEFTARSNERNLGWFASGSENRAIGDSFLYAGYFDNQAFISLIRFDLARVPRGAEIREVALHLTGLDTERLSSEDTTWSVQLIADNDESFVRLDFQTVFNLPASISLLPTLRSEDLGEGVTNIWLLGPAERAWIADQLLAGKSSILVRVTGPTGGDASLFSWDSGVGTLAGDHQPELHMRLGPAPATPPPLPTPRFVVATSTPTPANVLTVAAHIQVANQETATAAANPQEIIRVITPTPVAANVETAQAAAYLLGLPAIVESTPTPASPATQIAHALYATAVAMTTGTFTPVPPDAVTPIVIVPTPQPENAVTAVAQIATATAERLIGTPTPLPYNAVMATLTPTPLLIAATATPQNLATASFQVALATAIAQTTGTATPLPANATVVVPTATPNLEGTPVPLLLFLDQVTPTVQPTATPAPNAVPQSLFGKIIFWSDRNGSEQLFALDPVSGRLAQVTESWPFALAEARESISPLEPWVSLVVRDDLQRIPQVYVFDSQYNVDRSQVTSWPAQSYDPVWSPAGDRVAFVSVETGNDEIYTARPDGTEIQRLTQNGWEWDKHPTWSPDGTQIVFWSNRDSGRRQLWIMNADGSNVRPLISSPYNDWNPVWVK